MAEGDSVAEAVAVGPVVKVEEGSGQVEVTKWCFFRLPSLVSRPLPVYFIGVLKELVVASGK